MQATIGCFGLSGKVQIMLMGNLLMDKKVVSSCLVGLEISIPSLVR